MQSGTSTSIQIPQRLIEIWNSYVFGIFRSLPRAGQGSNLFFPRYSNNKARVVFYVTKERLRLLFLTNGRRSCEIKVWGNFCEGQQDMRRLEIEVTKPLRDGQPKTVGSFSEVRRVQNYVEMVDSLKARNAAPLCSNTCAVSTLWDRFAYVAGTLNTPTLPPSATVTTDWELFD